MDVNENLHRPVFSEFVYEAGVLEDAAVGTSVVMLTASDKDLGRDGVVRYHIHEGSGLGVFTIDEETGKKFLIACLFDSVSLGIWENQCLS